WRRSAAAGVVAAPESSLSKTARPPNYDSAFVDAGAVVGLVLGLALALLSGHIILRHHNGGVVVGLLLLGVPTSVAFLWAVRDWVKEGEMRTPLLVIGLIVLGVNFLAAGAASFPGVAQTAWILIPLTLGLHEPVAQSA